MPWHRCALCTALLIAASLVRSVPGQIPAIPPPGPGMNEADHSAQTFNGRLEDDGGAPISGVLVELHGWNGELIGTTETGTDGSFRFLQVPIGQYKLKGMTPTGSFSVSINESGDPGPIEVRVSPTPVGNRSIANESSAPEAGRISINDLQAPAKARQKLDRAIAALKKQNAGQALKFADQALQIDPAWSRAWVVRGETHRLLNQVMEARHDFKRAADSDPNSGLALAELAETYTYRNQWERAGFYLARATTVDPTAWQPWMELSRLQLLRGKYVEAARSARKALSTRPPAPEATRYLLGVAEAAQGHFAVAKRQFELYLASHPLPSPAVTDAVRKLQLIEQKGQAAAQPAQKH